MTRKSVEGVTASPWYWGPSYYALGQLHGPLHVDDATKYLAGLRKVCRVNNKLAKEARSRPPTIDWKDRR